MVRTFLKVYMELGSYFLFLQEQVKDIIIINTGLGSSSPVAHVLHYHPPTTCERPCNRYCSTHLRKKRPGFGIWGLRFRHWQERRACRKNKMRQGISVKCSGFSQSVHCNLNQLASLRNRDSDQRIIHVDYLEHVHTQVARRHSLLTRFCSWFCGDMTIFKFCR